MSKPAIQKARHSGDHHVAAPRSQGAGAFRLALCNAQGQAEVAFGDGLELALARNDAGEEIAPEWVQLFPAGPVIEARDGRRWTLPDPQALVAAFARNGADLPYDVNHATEIKGRDGEDAPAYGWIKGLQVREDRTVWARVDWTAEGAGYIAGKKYRYTSPAFLFDKNNEIKAVTSAALVTHPALNMPALARRGGGNPGDQPQMKTLAERLREALGLGVDATDDAIVTAATTQVALARDARDPAKLVPAADLQAALARATTAETELGALKKADADKSAETLVDQAIADGKIPPASKEHWLGLARENAEGVTKALASMPKLLTPTDKDKKVEGEGAETDADGLTADQKALCTQLGLEPKAYAATLKEQA